MISKIFNDKQGIKRKIIVILFTICFIVILSFINSGEKPNLVNKKGTSFEKAVVIHVIKDNIQEDGTRIGNQRVKLRLLSGELKGKEIEATSFAGYLYGADCTEGLKVSVSLSVSGDNIEASVYSFNREGVILSFIGIFFLLIWIIGGKKGLNSIIGLIFTFVCIIYMFIPMIFKGVSPFIAAIISISLITVVTLYLIGGLTKKTLAAIIGTISGVVIAGIFAAAFGHFAKISGYNVADIEELVYISNLSDLKIGGLLFAGILIASLGAVMDVAMSIASTITEIYEQNPKLNTLSLFKSGINVGRDMMGTMSNTLILAFTGGSINTLVFIYAYNMKYNQVINMYSVGIEIMQGISGSIGIILTVPLVSIVTSVLLSRKNHGLSKL